MAGLLSLLFLVAIGYGVYRVVKYVRYRNELARARDRVLAGMANMPDRRDEAAFNDGTVASEGASQVVMGTPIDAGALRRCSHCGAEMPHSAKFCGSCGKQLHM